MPVQNRITRDGILAAALKPEVWDKMVRVNASSYRLVALSAGLKPIGGGRFDFKRASWAKDVTLPSEKTGNLFYRWFTQRQMPWKTRISAATSAAGLTLTVDDTSPFVADANNPCYFRIERTGEFVRSTAIGSATSITVTRGQMNTAAAAVVVDDVLVYMGNNHIDGTAVPAGRTRAQQTDTNYCQSFIVSTQIGWAAMASETYTDVTEKMRSMEQAVQRFMGAVERAWLFNPYSGQVAGTANEYMSGGLPHFVTENILDLGPSGSLLTKAEFDAWASRCSLTDEGTTKMLVCGTNVENAVNSFYEDIIRQSTEDARKGNIGWWVKCINTTKGDIYVVPHAQMPADQAYLVDPSKMRLRWLKGKDKDLYPKFYDTSLPNITSEDECLYGVLGLQVDAADGFGMLKNVNG